MAYAHNPEQIQQAELIEFTDGSQFANCDFYVRAGLIFVIEDTSQSAWPLPAVAKITNITKRPGKAIGF